jgi:uncharacterized protein (DUF1684 family)
VTLTLLGWRRQVAALYAAARAARDPETGWRTWRDGRDELFAGHPDSPLDEAARTAFRGLPYAPYDPRLRYEVAALAAEPQRLEVPTATDGVVPFDRIGAVELDGIGRLDLWWLGSYGGGLFLPLRDGTAGQTTYGAGRYLLDTVKGADLGGEVDVTSGRGTLVVDLNFAYNPSCAYDSAWVCPLAPPGNTLAAPVRGGELYPVVPA